MADYTVRRIVEKVGKDASISTSWVIQKFSELSETLPTRSVLSMLIELQNSGTVDKEIVNEVIMEAVVRSTEPEAPSSRMIGNAVLELADSPPNYPQSFTTLSTGSRPTREGCHTTEIRSSEKASTAPRYPDVTKDRKHYDKDYPKTTHTNPFPRELISTNIRTARRNPKKRGHHHKIRQPSNLTFDPPGGPTAMRPHAITRGAHKETGISRELTSEAPTISSAFRRGITLDDRQLAADSSEDDGSDSDDSRAENPPNLPTLKRKVNEPVMMSAAKRNKVSSFTSEVFLQRFHNGRAEGKLLQSWFTFVSSKDDTIMKFNKFRGDRDLIFRVEPEKLRFQLRFETSGMGLTARDLDSDEVEWVFILAHGNEIADQLRAALMETRLI